MNYWGKVAGGLIGWVAGGPVGAALGMFLGHQFDRGFQIQMGEQAYRAEYGDPRLIQTTFFHATFSIMGHIAKADGRVSEDEIRAARAVMYHMHLTPEQVKSAIALFTEGKRSDFALDQTLLQFRRDVHQRHDLFRAFVEIQMQAALASGKLHRVERDVLWRICRNLGISRVELAQIEALVRAQRGFGRGRGAAKRSHQGSLGDAYKVLGVERNATDKEVKTAYRRLINQHHPDKLVAKGLPESMLSTAKEKTREINSAYDTVKESRGMK